MRLDLAGESKRSILDSFWLSPALFILECGGPAPLWPVLSTANQAVLAAKRFRAWETIASVGESAARPARRRFGLFFHLQIKCFGGEAISRLGDYRERRPTRCQASPAPLWPVLSTANQAVLAAKRFRAWETIASVGQSAARPARCRFGLFFQLQIKLFWRRSDFAPGRLSRA